MKYAWADFNIFPGYVWPDKKPIQWLSLLYNMLCIQINCKVCWDKYKDISFPNDSELIVQSINWHIMPDLKTYNWDVWVMYSNAKHPNPCDSRKYSF